VLSVGRKIASSLVNSASKPLSELEFIGLPIPKQCCDRFRRASPNYEANWCFVGQQYMYSSSDSRHIAMTVRISFQTADYYLGLLEGILHFHQSSNSIDNLAILQAEYRDD
jgi:hypothetical protein